MAVVPLFNLAPQLSVSRLCFGSSSSTSPSLFHFPFALNHELNPCRPLLRNHDIRRAELPLRIISPPRPSLRRRNQLLRLRGNVFLPSPSDVIPRRISFSRVSMIAFFPPFCRYPVPQCAETQGRSEDYLGRWIRDRKIPRDRLVLATKVFSFASLKTEEILLLLLSLLKI